MSVPTCWSDEDRSELLEISEDGLGVKFRGSATMTRAEQDAAAVRTRVPLLPDVDIFYFEMMIEHDGGNAYMGIGFSGPEVPLDRFPGWEASSWAYHGDDGKAYHGSGNGQEFGPAFATGDTVGCGITYLPERAGLDSGDAGRIFFTKNGHLLGFRFAGVPRGVLPTIGLRTAEQAVRANFGGDLFMFDVGSIV